MPTTQKVRWHYWLAQDDWLLSDALCLLFDAEPLIRIPVAGQATSHDDRKKFDFTRPYAPPLNKMGLDDAVYSELVSLFYRAVVQVQEGKFDIGPKKGGILFHQLRVPIRSFLKWVVDNHLSYPIEMQEKINEVRTSLKKIPLKPSRICFQLASEKWKHSKKIPISAMAKDPQIIKIAASVSHKTICKWISGACPNPKVGRPKNSPSQKSQGGIKT